ncbi:MAG: DUF169 domain-containing protein [Oscillospiraceae bacterium]|nr:DUF169 domain-containing protein [Oscillospiraceae bacterium]
MTIQQYNEYGKFLDDTLRLETYPIAVKFFDNLEDIPKNAIFPKRDMGKHMAFCQAKAMTRMRGMTIALTKEDHWCWNPLIAFGMVDCTPGTDYFNVIKKYIGVPADKADEFLANFPRLELGKCKAVVTSPLHIAEFEPDVILVYSNTMQLNMMLRAVKSMTGTYVKSEFDGIDSCAYATVPPVLNGEYRVTVPDPGDVERARAGKDEMIFSIPPHKLEEVCTGLKGFEKFHMDYRNTPWLFPFDFERPPFYNEVFEMWGLEKGEDWNKVR